jgi:gliding motility-associated-like protein
MRKPLIVLIIILLFSSHINAQWYTINNVSGTTATYGPHSVSVLGTGTYSTYPGWCGAGNYWIGAGTGGTPNPATYTFTVSPTVSSLRIFITAADPGESFWIAINGSRYPITALNFYPWASTCGTGAMSISGDSLLSGVSDGSGEINITDCPMSVIEVGTNGLLNGTVFTFMISDSGKCFRAWNSTLNYNIYPSCLGDTLFLNAFGDSVGATYAWLGPGGLFTSTQKNPFIWPTTWADTGTYRVIRTIGPASDTAYTHVMLYPYPIVTPTNNSPLCAGLIDTLQLSVNLFSPLETFAWTGPFSFASTLQNPTIPGFLPVSVGVYTVVATTEFGCSASGTTNVSLVPPPAPPVINGIPAYCFGQPFVPFSVTGYSGILEWYTVPTGGTATALAPTINTSAAGTYTVYVSQRIGSCESGRAAFTVLVRPQIIPLFTWNATLGCSSDQVTFTNLSNASWYIWEFGDLSTSTDTFTTSHTFKPSTTTQTVKLRAFIPGCEQDTTAKIDLVHNVRALFTPLPDTFCAAQLTLKAGDSFTVFQNNSYSTEPNGPGGTPNLAGLTGIAGGADNGASKITSLVTYSWTFGDGTTDNVQSPIAHIYNTGGLYHVTLSVTDSLGCRDTTSRDVVVLQFGINMTHDTMLCISQPLPLLNSVIAVPRIVDGNVGLTGSKNYQNDDFIYSWTPDDGHLDDTAARVPHYTGQGVTTYTFTATEKQYGCYAVDTERIRSVVGIVLQNLTQTTTISFGNSIQLNADSEVIYMWKPDDGSLNNANINNPVAKPTVTTLYTVYGYDHNGCLDSAYVHVIVDSTMTEDIPTGFTPNGDGLNDVFRPVGLRFQNMVEFRVYNRWGQQLFYSNNPKVGWDGTFNGVPQDLGVYYYSIIVARPGGEGGDITYKGEVTLIR